MDDMVPDRIPLVEFLRKRIAAQERTIAELRAKIPASETVAHIDHPMRHWDRTCPACIAEGETVAVPRTDLNAALNYILHCGANTTMRGEPHPQQRIVDAIVVALAARPKGDV